MTISEFILARVAEDEASVHVDEFERTPHTERCGYDQLEFAAECECHWPARLLRQCWTVRRILEVHDAWPVLVETPPEFSSTPGPDATQVAFRVSQQMAWLTTREYRNRFGDKPPTTPMLAALAAMWSDHPDYRAEWAS